MSRGERILNNAQFRYMIIIFSTVIMIIIIYALYQNIKLKYKNASLMQQKYMQDERIAELSIYKKEVNHLISQINAEIHNNDNIAHLVDECKKYTSEFITGEPVVDVLIAYKKRCCAEKAIAIDIEIKQIMPGILSEDEYVGLLGNLIDNGIEAAEKTEHPWIQVKSKNLQGTWLLKVRNSKLPEEQPLDNKMATTKNDKANHGIGTKIINKIVKAHMGEIERIDEGDSFEVVVAISNK